MRRASIAWLHANIAGDDGGAPRILINIVDGCDAFHGNLEQTCAVLDVIRQFGVTGLSFEDDRGTYFPFQVGAYVEVARAYLPDQKILVHMHAGGGFENASLIEAILAGADGVWGGLPKRAAIIGHASLGELLAYFNGTFPDDHPFKDIHATPGRGYQPDVWLLGSSLYSAQLAGLLGLPFSFAHHFSGENTEAAVAAYREAFDPTGVLDQPYVMLGVNVLCAPTLDEARYLAGPGKLAMARLRSGRPDVYPTPEEAAAHEYSPQEQAVAHSWGRHHVIGPPEAVRSGLLDLAERTGADELMVTTMTHGFDERVRSYSLVADAMELKAAPERV